LINIFGGILRVDTLATGVVEAARKTNIKLPIVLRLEGTNVDEGKKILKDSGFNFIVTGYHERSRRSSGGSGAFLKQHPVEDSYLLAILVNKKTRLIVQDSLAARAPSTPGLRCLRNAGGRRSHARQGRDDARGLAHI